MEENGLAVATIMIRYGDIRKLVWRGHPSRRYYVRVHRPDNSTTWKCTGFADLDLARAQVRQWQLDVIVGHAPASAVPLVRDALRRWYSVVALGRSVNYARCLDGWVRRIAPAFDGRTVDTITDQDLSAWIAGRLAAGKRPGTVNMDLTLARMFCSWCVERGWLPRNPVTRRMRVTVPQAQVRVVSPTEETALLNAAAAMGARPYGFVLCLLTTGFRSGLTCKVCWQHVDFGLGAWAIPAPLVKSRRAYCKPVPPCLLAWLAGAAPAEAIGFIWGPGARFWWYDLRERAGLPDLKMHDLRRTFITRCRRAQVPIEVTMALADHRDFRTMMTVYRRVDDGDMRQALERLEAQRRDVCDG